MLKELLEERNYLPILKMNDGRDVTLENWEERRREMIELLEKYSYGRTPEKPTRVWGENVEEYVNNYAGKAKEKWVDVCFETSFGKFSFPVKFYIPYRVKKPSVFLHIAFRPVPDKYIPVEEIIDGGYALAVVVYKDLVNDNQDSKFDDGLGKYFGLDKDRKGDSAGKISLWAYGASRVLDYMINEMSDEVDTEKVAVIGHSRLGKTALWCAAQDERFVASISNNSGYGGAASSKMSTGEKIDDFIRAGSVDFFCENFKMFQGKEDEKPYDQAFLLSLIAPRYLLVGSARYDVGACPRAEFLTSLHSSSAWELFGEKGLVCPDRLPTIGDNFTEGKINYHLRDDNHYLSREDWNIYMNYLDLKFGKKERIKYYIPILYKGKCYNDEKI